MMKLKQEIVYRYCSDNDLDELSRFVGKFLWTKGYELASHWEALFRWKHFANPFGKSEMAVAVDHGGKIVTFIAGMHWKLVAGEHLIKCLRWTDLISDPDFRREPASAFAPIALAAKLREKARLEDVSLFFGSGANTYSLAFTSNLGWKDVERLWPLVSVNYHQALASVIRSKLSHKRQNGYDTKNYFKRAPLPVTSLLSHDGIESLLQKDQKLEDSSPLTICKTVEYLKWRYVDHPTITYYTLIREQGGELTAAVIFRISTDLGLRDIVIDEIFMSSPGEGVSLLNELRETVTADYLLTRFSLGSWKRDVFLKSGFGTRSRIMRYYYSHSDVLLDRLLVDSFDKTIPVDSTLPENWALTMGDLEGF